MHGGGIARWTGRSGAGWAQCTGEFFPLMKVGRCDVARSWGAAEAERQTAACGHARGLAAKWEHGASGDLRRSRGSGKLKSMRFRAIVGMSVAVLLLSVSCVASACETSCALKALAPGCHDAGGGAVTAAHPGPDLMPGMGHCGMAKGIQAPVLQADAVCNHSSVCEQPAQTIGDSEAGRPAQLISTAHAGVTAFALPVEQRRSRSEPADRSTSRAPLLVALQTNLRV